MKKLFLALIMAIMIPAGILASTSNAEAYTVVKGYYRSNGTYVRSYVRSNPNGLKYDNYGYRSSQSLYNPTYGTRSYSWDTPTWNTDSNYYAGLNLYRYNYRF